MSLSDCELWLLNLYRNSELHGALLMGRLAKVSTDPEVLRGATQHCATEAQHAALLTELILDLGARVDSGAETIQQYYSKEGGIPKEVVELLVVSEVLERRVVLSYREHLQRSEVHPRVREVLRRIMDDEEAHSGKEGWAERVLEGKPTEQVKTARQKWDRVDEKVAADLHRLLQQSFTAGDSRR